MGGAFSLKIKETYLFRAACSELRTEILNARKASTNKMATQRAHLQHEVDILSQKASQEALTLKDDLRGMLNDRRMDVRMDQQARDSAIQELNYKITVALNSDSKSEVEGLRWILTRRAAMAIAGMARKSLLSFPSHSCFFPPPLRNGLFRPSSIRTDIPDFSAVLILGSLRYSTYKLQQRQQHSQPPSSSIPSSNSTSNSPQNSESSGGAIRPPYTVPAREAGTQTDTLIGSVDSLG